MYTLINKIIVLALYKIDILDKKKKKKLFQSQSDVNMMSSFSIYGNAIQKQKCAVYLIKRGDIAKPLTHLTKLSLYISSV